MSVLAARHDDDDDDDDDENFNAYNYTRLITQMVRFVFTKFAHEITANWHCLFIVYLRKSLVDIKSSQLYFF